MSSSSMQTAIRPTPTDTQLAMRRHREHLLAMRAEMKYPKHPGFTQKESGYQPKNHEEGYQPEEHELLAAGVCADMAVAEKQADRIVHWILIVCGSVVILHVIGKSLGWW